MEGAGVSELNALSELSALSELIALIEYDRPPPASILHSPFFLPWRRTRPKPGGFPVEVPAAIERTGESDEG